MEYILCKHILHHWLCVYEQVWLNEWVRWVSYSLCFGCCLWCHKNWLMGILNVPSSTSISIDHAIVWFEWPKIKWRNNKHKKNVYDERSSIWFQKLMHQIDLTLFRISINFILPLNKTSRLVERIKTKSIRELKFFFLYNKENLTYSTHRLVKTSSYFFWSFLKYQWFSQ